MNEDRGTFREFEHTADLGIESTAADLPRLFAAAGEGLFSLIADPENIDPRDQVTVSAVGSGPEELLHAWLRELLSQFNLDGFVGKTCVVERLTDARVDGIVHGETLDLSRHRFRTEIKGVTYHDFKVWQENGAWHARVIFDV